MSYSRNNRFQILLALFLLGTAAIQAEPPATELLKLHTSEAQAYRIFGDENHTQELQLQVKPVFTWTNLVGESTQLGHLFVWTSGDRPEVIGTMFSTRAADQTNRILIHEFHTLSTSQVFPITPKNSDSAWHPQRGITLVPCDGAPSVAESAAARLVQMRGIARTFSADSQDSDGKKWELRLLTTPLWQYKPKSDEVLEGALFAMVSSAGTDPELILVIEARRADSGRSTWQWHTAPVRFSDKDLIVKRNAKTVWSSLVDPQHKAEIKNNYTLIETPDKTYSCYRSHLIRELPDSAKP